VVSRAGLDAVEKKFVCHCKELKPNQVACHSSHRLVSIVNELSQLLAGMVACVEEYSVQKFQVCKHELQELANVERDERMIIYRDLEGIGEEIVTAYFKLHYRGICKERLKCSVFVPCNWRFPNASLHQTCSVQC